MGAKLSVRSRSAYSNLEDFHGASISTNDFPPYIGDAFIPFSFLSANSPQNRCQVNIFEMEGLQSHLAHSIRLLLTSILRLSFLPCS
jgi:hypothetical protein